MSNTKTKLTKTEKIENLTAQKEAIEKKIKNLELLKKNLEVKIENLRAAND